MSKDEFPKGKIDVARHKQYLIMYTCHHIPNQFKRTLAPRCLYPSLHHPTAYFLFEDLEDETVGSVLPPLVFSTVHHLRVTMCKP